jgi:hypothetical protein
MRFYFHLFYAMLSCINKIYQSVETMRFNKNKYLKDMEQTDVERIRLEQISIAFRQAFASIFPLFLGALIISILY